MVYFHPELNELSAYIELDRENPDFPFSFYSTKIKRILLVFSNRTTYILIFIKQFNENIRRIVMNFIWFAEQFDIREDQSLDKSKINFRMNKTNERT